MTSKSDATITFKIDFDRQTDLLRAASRAVGFLSAVTIPEHNRKHADEIVTDLRAAVAAVTSTQKVAA